MLSISLSRFQANLFPLTKVGGKTPPGTHGQLLIVQDVEGGVFGAWISEGVHLSHGVYYGGGDSYVLCLLS